MSSVQCDAINANGQRCRCRIAKKNVDQHKVKQPFGFTFGVLCTNHWAQINQKGKKVQMRSNCHPLLQHGLQIFTAPYMSDAHAYAAGMLTVTHGQT